MDLLEELGLDEISPLLGHPPISLTAPPPAARPAAGEPPTAASNPKASPSTAVKTKTATSAPVVMSDGALPVVAVPKPGAKTPAAPAPKPLAATKSLAAAAKPTVAATKAAVTKAPASAAVKRGPGRPPSKPPAPALERKGIVDSPKDPNNRLEFVYGNPAIFKTLFTYFKNIKAKQIHLRCNPKGITFFARDQTLTSRVVAHIAGEQVNWYYCESEYLLGIKREDVEKIFTSIDKVFYKITIIQCHDDPNRLQFVLKDPDIEKECNYTISLPQYPRDEDLYEAEKILTPESMIKEFPIDFTLTAKQFKKSVGDASAFSEVLTFERVSGHPFQLTYVKGNITYNEVYRSAEKIRLRCDAPDGETFRCEIKIANVRSLSSSMVTDDVRIFCRETGDILFRSAVDAKALVVSTLTKLA